MTGDAIQLSAAVKNDLFHNSFKTSKTHVRNSAFNVNVSERDKTYYFLGDMAPKVRERGLENA